MRQITLTLTLDDQVDPPTTRIHVEDGTARPPTSQTITAESFFDVLRRVDKATDGDLLAVVGPDMRATLDQLRERIAQADEQQAARRAAEAELAPVAPDPA